MSTLPTTLNTALRTLMAKQEESDMAVVDKRTCVNRATAALQASQGELSRALFEEKKTRDALIELVNYLKEVPNGGTTVERHEQLRLSEVLAGMVECTRIARLSIHERQQELGQATSDLEYARSRHERIIDECSKLTERISRLPSD